jgi:hypothetical protein
LKCNKLRRRVVLEASVGNFRPCCRPVAAENAGRSAVELILIIIVIVLLFGGGGYYGHRRGYYGGGGISLIGLLAILLVIFLIFGYR